MGASYEFIEASASMTNPQILLPSLLSAVTLGTAAAKTFAIVHQGEMGIRTRGGSPRLKPEIDALLQEIKDDRLSPYDKKNFTREQEDELVEELKTELTQDQLASGIYRVEGRGLKVLRPLTDKIVTINVADRSDAILGFDVESSDEKQFCVVPTFTWYVRRDGDHVHSALFKVNNEKDNKDKDKVAELKQRTISICKSGLGRVLQGRDSSDLLIPDPDEVEASTKALCKDKLIRYGVELRDVELLPIARTYAEVLKQAIENSRNPKEAAFVAAALAAGPEGKGSVLSLVPDKPA